MQEELRRRIIDDPELVLEDLDVMRALVSAKGSSLGSNIVDLRGIALERMEARLRRLEDTHRSVIAAAYENLAGTNQIHRAVLRLLEPTEFTDFLAAVNGSIAEVLRVDCARLVLETLQADEDDGQVHALHDVLVVAGKGFVQGYMDARHQPADRQVILRQVRPETGQIYGDRADWIRSEACLKLDFGPGKLPGMLVLGAEDPHQFKPTQGTDLLTFLAGAFERAMRRWLA